MSWYCDALSRPTTLQAVQIDRLTRRVNIFMASAAILRACCVPVYASRRSASGRRAAA